MKRNGFSLMELTLSLAIGSVLSLVAASMLGETAKQKSHAMELAQLEGVKQSILKTLGNSAAWTRTIANNPNMACLDPVNAIPCLANVPQPFTLFDANNDVVADSVNPASGFASKGEACPVPSFNINIGVGNDACPYKFQLQWSAVCSPLVPCTNPQVLVNAHLFYRPSQGSAMKVTLSEDRHSVNDFYISNTASMCLSNVQQIFIYNTTPGIPLNTIFTVPNYSNNLFVELWGGGGGGTGQNSIVPNPGSPGGASTFAAAPVVTALGGAGGGPWWDFASMGCCWSVPICIGVGAGFVNGWPAYNPTNPNLLSGLTPNSCSPVNSSSMGGAGGPGAYFYQNWLSGGSYGGGGGGAGWLWGNAMTACPIFQLFGVGAGPGVPAAFPASAGGRYAASPVAYTPATLPPGTPVPVTVGAGGAPGLVGTCVWVGFPFCVWGTAGPGGPGVAKITWQ